LAKGPLPCDKLEKKTFICSRDLAHLGLLKGRGLRYDGNEVVIIFE
jgi:hypothetical protein